MGLLSQGQVPGSTIALERHAADQLRFIRSTMERASVFTALPGWGGVFIGLSALLTGIVASGHSLREQFFFWISEALVAVLIGTGALLWKANRTGQSLLAKPAKRALFSFAVPLFVAAMLTVALYRTGDFSLFAGLWLSLYGVAIVAAGAHSVRIVPVMGLSFVAMGTAALLVTGHGNSWMMAGFGGLHLLFGFEIAGRYGG